VEQKIALEAQVNCFEKVDSRNQSSFNHEEALSEAHGSNISKAKDERLGGNCVTGQKFFQAATNLTTNKTFKLYSRKLNSAYFIRRSTFKNLTKLCLESFVETFWLHFLVSVDFSLYPPTIRFGRRRMDATCKSSDT